MPYFWGKKKVIFKSVEGECFRENMHPCYPIMYDDDGDTVLLLVSDNVDDAENDLESNDAQVGEEYTHLHPLHNLQNIKYSYHVKLK